MAPIEKKRNTQRPLPPGPELLSFDHYAHRLVMSAAPPESSLWADDDFTLAEPEYALKVCRRGGTPGGDGISSQALKSLTFENLQIFLEELDTT